MVIDNMRVVRSIKTKTVKTKKVKFQFLAYVKTARLITKERPNQYKVKKRMSTSVGEILRLAGYKLTGRISYPKGGECYGLSNGTEHLTVSDCGAFPWNLGDTLIEVVPTPMTTFHQCPIELR